MHWIVERITDPIGKILRDLNYLEFRRSLLMAMTFQAEEVKLCVHSDCAETFKNVEFFKVKGSEHAFIPVKDREEATRKGAEGFICSCQPKSDAVSKMEFRNV